VSEVQTNVWITFHGEQQSDGVVVADDARFTKNTISRGEDHLRKKSEFDPAAVDPNAKQGGVSKAFRGIDPKQIPPYKDEAMQVRVESIGKKLVPAYQRDMPYTEEPRIDFRFQVIDNAKWRDAVTLENGIILVPRQVVERMQNDSQLAAILADNIACALEKQPLNLKNEGNRMDAAEVIGTGVGLIIPGAGVASEIVLGSAASRLQRQRQEQSGRVGLALMKDAGYDISQAPLAWWLAAPKETQGYRRHPPSRTRRVPVSDTGRDLPAGLYALCFRAAINDRTHSTT
jgi:predicted Zn-dependent protease